MPSIKQLFLVLLFAAFAGCGHKEAVWREVAVPEGGYRIQMPGDPQRTEEHPSVDYSMVIYQSHSDRKHLFSAGVGEDLLSGAPVFGKVEPGSRDRAMLEGGKKRLLAGGDTELLSEKDLTLEGITGKELILKMKESKWKKVTVAFRFYVKESQLIQLMVQTTVENPSSDPQVARFFESLRLDAPKTVPPVLSTARNAAIEGLRPPAPSASPETPLPGEKIFRLKNGQTVYGRVTLTDKDYYNIKRRDGSETTVLKEDIVPES